MGGYALHREKHETGYGMVDHLLVINENCQVTGNKARDWIRQKKLHVFEIRRTCFKKGRDERA